MSTSCLKQQLFASDPPLISQKKCNVNQNKTRPRVTSCGWGQLRVFRLEVFCKTDSLKYKAIFT